MKTRSLPSTVLKRYPTLTWLFLRVTLLPDPKRILEGTGKGMRHIKMHSEKDINKKQIISWIKETIKLNVNFFMNAQRSGET
jgi:hypothetical protein